MTTDWGNPPYNIDQMAYVSAAVSSFDYANEHMRGLPRFSHGLELLEYAADQALVDGIIMEFGVHTGTTLNALANRRPDRKVYGFDSFQGLPEQWVPGMDAGHFAVTDLPVVPSNTELVAGWFDRTLPDFLDRVPDNASLIHIDCDLYSSTQTVLAALRNRIVSGTVIVFDEYFNYPDWRLHEHLAFKEYVHRYDIRYRYIGLVPQYEQVAAIIL